MSQYDELPTYAQDGAFETTRWTQIREVRDGSHTAGANALAILLERYWRPVYCYLRHKGYSNEVAEDLVQGFCQEIVLGNDLVPKADPTRGRFRTFLLTALDHYVVGVHRAEAARKRRPEGGVLHLDEGVLSQLSSTEMDATPEMAFQHAWASTLLDEVLEGVELMCRHAGQQTHWEIFRARVVYPIMDRHEVVSLKTLCEKYNIPDERQASNMIVTTKRRFRRLLLQRVSQFAESDADVEREIQELFQILSGR